MSSYTYKHRNWRLPIALALAGIVANASMRAEATDIVLTDGTAEVRIDTASQIGTYKWSLNGLDHLAQQWFWYRTSTGAEASVDTIDLTPSITLTGSNEADVVYTNGVLEVRIGYTLLGGGNTSSLTEDFKITNVSGVTYTLNFFQYADFDLKSLSGPDQDDTVEFIAPFKVTQKDGSGVVLGEAVTTNPGSTLHHEADLKGIGPIGSDTLDRLNDFIASTLSDADGPLTGNATWAFQWTQSLDPGESMVFSKDKSLQIPAPGAWLLGAMGFAFAARKSKRARA